MGEKKKRLARRKHAKGVILAKMAGLRDAISDHWLLDQNAALIAW
jgi:hypothetical protein